MKKSKTRAQSMVELALVLPIMILVVMGLVEFGRALFIYTVISNAAREGVRAGLVDPHNTAWVEDRIRARLVLVNPDAVTIIVNYDNGTDGGQFSNPEDIQEGRDRIRVDVSTDFQMITPVIGGIFPPTTIRYVSARTIVAGARVRKTPGPSSTPVPGLPTHTPPGGLTYTPLPATDTPAGPPPTPLVLNVSFAAGYPCRGQEQNVNKGHIRVLAYVTDNGGLPVTGATVSIDLEGAVLTDLGNGYYGGSTGNCWTSASSQYGDQNIFVDANKAGYVGDSTQASTAGKVCDGGCVGEPPPTWTPSPTVPTSTPSPTYTPGPPTDTPTVTPILPTSTPTPIPPTPTPTPIPPTPSPTPQALDIVFVSGYPCLQGGGAKPIRVKAYVTDNAGNPVSDATVTVSIAGGGAVTMSPVSGQPGYYGSTTSCWASDPIYSSDQNVTISAAKAGFSGDSDTANTNVNPTCSKCP